MPSLSYSLTDKDGKPGLLVSVEEKSYSPPIVRPLINIDGTNYNEVLFSAGARITFLDFGTFGSELRNDVVVGLSIGWPRNTIIRSLLLPDGSSLRRSPSTPTNSISTIDNHIDSQYRKRQFGGALDVGYTFGTVRRGPSGISVGLSTIFSGNWRYGDLSHPIGPCRSHPVSLQSRPGEDPVLPMRGMSATFRGEWWDSNTGTKKPFPLAELRTHFLFPLTPKSSAYLAVSGGSTLGYENTGIPPFSLGGGLHSPPLARTS